MPTLRLPHGPWKSLLYGKYEGKDVSIYQNPQRDILYVVADRDEKGNPKGLVVTVYRGFYLERGDLKHIVTHLSGLPVGLVKKWKDGVFQFLLIPAGIKYIGTDPNELRQTVDEMVLSLNRMEKNILILANTMGFLLTPLATVPRNVAALLFVEPVFVAGLAPKELGQEVKEGGLVVLGTDRQGRVIRDSVVNLRRSVVYGESDGRRKAFAILLEEFLRNGVNVFMVTENAQLYKGVSSASSNDLSSFGLRPMGFSFKVMEPLIDLSLIPPKALLEIIGVKENTNTSKKLIEVLKTFGPEATKPAEVAQKIEENDAASLRTGRILTALDLAEGSRFGKPSYAVFTTLSSTGLGGLYALEVREPWDYLSLLSYLVGIGEALRRRGKSEEPKVILFVERGEKVFTREENPVTKALVEVLDRYKSYGLGWVVEAEKEVALNDYILALTEARIGVIGPDDVGVRTLTQRPYRVKLRPFLSSIEEHPTPGASSPPTLPPGHR